VSVALFGGTQRVARDCCAPALHERTLRLPLTLYACPTLRSAFWAGLDAKLFESATKGAILMYSKESINASLLASGTDPVLAGIAAGAGGGVCQVAVMGPCTFLVTGAVTSGSKMSTMERARETWCVIVLCRRR
jgi:hypothetical protein